jgi:hypothetical protein
VLSAAKLGGKYGIKQLARDYHKKYGVNFETFYQRIVKQQARDKARGKGWDDGLELLVRNEKEKQIDDKHYHGEMTDLAAFDAAMEWGTYEGIAIELKVPTSTVKRWLNQYETFKDLVVDGINKAKAKAEKNLLEQGLTQVLSEKKKEYGSNDKGDYEKTVEIVKEVKGDAKATLSWLQGNMKEKYGKEASEKKEEKGKITIVVGGK